MDPFATRMAHTLGSSIEVSIISKCIGIVIDLEFVSFHATRMSRHMHSSGPSALVAIFFTYPDLAQPQRCLEVSCQDPFTPSFDELVH